MQAAKEPDWFNYPKFYEFIAQQDFKVLVEVGVFLGKSLSFLTKEIGKKQNIADVKIYGVDAFETGAAKAEIIEMIKEIDINDFKAIADKSKKLPEIKKILGKHKYNIVKQRIAETNFEHLVTIIKDDSALAANLFDDQSVDFVFIDAAHDYASVKRDILAWLPKVKNGGIISGHDYTYPGVNMAVNELLSDVIDFSNSTLCWYKKI